VAGRRGVNRSDAEVLGHWVAQRGTDRDLSRLLSAPTAGFRAAPRNFAYHAWRVSI